MAEPQADRTSFTEEAYFRLDDESEERLTFFHGEIFAMVGASFEHNQICTNIGAHFNRVLPESCYTVGGSMRVQVEARKHDTYPDVLVVCGEPEFLDAEKRTTLLNPLLIAEVLSTSTRNFDRGDKFASYRNIETLKHYLLVSQYAFHVEHFYQNDQGRWELEEKTDPEETVFLDHLDCDLPLETIYRRIGRIRQKSR